MSGSSSDNEEPPAGKTEETDHEAQELQLPLPFLPGFCLVSARLSPGRVQRRAPNAPPKAREPHSTLPPGPAGPAYQGLGLEPLLGEPGCQEAGKGEEGPEAGRREDNQEAEPLEEEPSPTFEPLEEGSPVFEPLEEEREKLPDLEGPQKSAKPPAPEGPHNPEDGKYLWDKPLLPLLNELQEMEEEDELNLATGGGLIREQGRDRELARPAREEVLDRTNTTCRPREIDFGERRPFLQHNQSAHQRKLRTKSDRRLPPPRGTQVLLALPVIQNPPPRGAPRGESGAFHRHWSRKPGPHSGRSEPAAHDRLGGRPPTHCWSLGAFRGPFSGAVRSAGLEDPAARPQRRPPRGSGQESRLHKLLVGLCRAVPGG